MDQGLFRRDDRRETDRFAAADCAPGEIHAETGMRVLHPRFSIAFVVDHDQRQVARLLHADGRERSQAHQHVAIAGDHQDAPGRLGSESVCELRPLFEQEDFGPR